MNKLTRYASRFFWLFCWIMKILIEQNELISLVQWAKRKRLNKRQQAYALRLNQLDGWLASVRVHNRGQVILCEFLYSTYQQLKPTPKYYKKGSAAQYRFA
jgi:hypothetical protein